MKERYAVSDMRKQANRMNFAEVSVTFGCLVVDFHRLCSLGVVTVTDLRFASVCTNQSPLVTLHRNIRLLSHVYIAGL